MLRVLFILLPSLLIACSKDKPAPIAPASKAVAIADAPAAPTNLRVAALTDTSARVAWDAVEGATDYDLNYKTLDGRWTNWPIRGARKAYATVYPLLPDTEYRWAVRAENADGPSGWVFGENFTTIPNTTFKIELVFLDDFSDKELKWMTTIAQQWEFFFFDAPNYVFAEETQIPIYDGPVQTIAKGEVIDDLRIYVGLLSGEWVNSISVWSGQPSGTSDVLMFRDNGDVPLIGLILMNRDEIDREIREQMGGNREYKERQWRKTFHHELGHTFGIGPSPAWIRNVYWPDNFSAWFRGENANREYRLMAPDASEYLGIDETYEGIPLSVSSLRKPRKAIHWYLLSPLKVGFFTTYWLRDNDLPNISRTTLGAFEDIGWSVDYEKGLTTLGPWWNDPNVGWPECRDGTFYLCPENMLDPEKEEILREIMSQ